MYPGSEDPNKPAPEPRPALALAAAAVERALSYVAEGRITLATIQADQQKSGFLITAEINPVTNKRATLTIAFSDDLWGANVWGYLQTIQKLHKSDMDSIILQARKCSRATATQAYEDEDDDHRHRPSRSQNARAQILLNYDDDDGNDDAEAQDAMEDDTDDNEVIEDVAPHQESQYMYEDSMEAYNDEPDAIDYEDGHAEYNRLSDGYEDMEYAEDE